MKMISLFDYLGRPGGPELGAKTTSAAVSMGIKLETRYVETSGYKGNVMLYPENFLKMYFGNTK